jgi:hypothetical protein
VVSLMQLGELSSAKKTSISQKEHPHCTAGYLLAHTLSM